MTSAALQLFFPPTLPLQDSSRWFDHAIQVSPDGIIKQTSGGPCAVLAALQANLVSYTHFLKQPVSSSLPRAILDMLKQARSNNNSTTITIATCPSPITLPTASTLVTYETLNAVTDNDDVVANNRINEIVSSTYSKPGGIMLLVLSLIQTRGGADAIRSDMDDVGGYLVGDFGHAGQELVNLCIIGKALSQVHDGIMTMENGLRLRGLEDQPRIGFLTRLEALRYVKVGSYYKNPKLPIWVLGSESHFTVIHCEGILDDKKSPTQEAYERSRRVFSSKDVHENGFVLKSELVAILQGIGFTGDMQRLADLCGDSEVILWGDFWNTYGGKVVSGDMNITAAAAAGGWICGACTYINASSTATRCEMCESPAPSSLPPSTKAPPPPPPMGPVDEVGGRQLRMYHIDGLQRTIKGTVMPPRRVPFTLTTCDEAVAQVTGSNTVTGGWNGPPFEETLQTKWHGAVFDYGVGGMAPSIVG